MSLRLGTVSCETSPEASREAGVFASCEAGVCYACKADVCASCQADLPVSFLNDNLKGRGWFGIFSLRQKFDGFEHTLPRRCRHI